MEQSQPPPWVVRTLLSRLVPCVRPHQGGAATGFGGCSIADYAPGSFILLLAGWCLRRLLGFAVAFRGRWAKLISSFSSRCSGPSDPSCTAPAEWLRCGRNGCSRSGTVTAAGDAGEANSKAFWGTALVLKAETRAFLDAQQLTLSC
jgi:hypothetical protein